METSAKIQLALQAVAFLAQLVPAIEQDVAQAKAVDADTDLSSVNAQIDQLHADTLNLTAKIDALR